MSGSETEYDDLRDVLVKIDGGVGTIRMLPSGDAQYRRQDDEGRTEKKFFPKHKEVGDALWRMRDDNRVRVIVLTGAGPMFFIPPSTSPGIGAHDPGEDWDLTQGLSKTLLGFVETNKPIIGRVNGDAVGFGSSMLFACDFVVAVEDAFIGDHHVGMGETGGYGRPDAAVVPGDGGMVYVPPALPPALLNEYMMLGVGHRASRLAELGVIYRAVPESELDAVVTDLVAALLRRAPHALALTKRMLSRRRFLDFGMWFDGAWGYEMANFYMNRDQGERGRSAL